MQADSLLAQAFGLFQAGDRAAAEQLCRDVLRLQPAHAHAVFLMGVILLAGERGHDAMTWLQRAAKALPHDPMVMENLGLALLMTGKTRAAEAQFRKAIATAGPAPSAVMRLGLALQARGKLDEALQAFERAAKLAPDVPDVHLNLGNAHARRGEWPQASAAYRRAIEIRPGHPDALFNLARISQDAGEFGAAEAAYRDLLALAPEYVDAWINLGVALSDQERFDEAMACFEKALGIAPGHPAALAAKGASLLKQGRFAHAVTILQQAVRRAPAFADAHVNLGLAAREIGLVPLSVASFRQALALQPDQTDVHCYLAEALFEAGDLEAAKTAYEKAIALGPTASLHLGMVNLAKIRGDHPQAIASADAALQSEPDNAWALLEALHQRQSACAWEQLPGLRSRLSDIIAARPEATCSPFAVLSIYASPAQQLEVARRWARKEIDRFDAMRADLEFDFSRRAPHDRIRIGYLSSDLHSHATAYLIAEVLELHDRSQFEIFAYSYGVDDNSPMRARIVAAFDRFCDARWLSVPDMARAIYDDGVDILIDLKGYTAGSRNAVLGLRPAPIQVNWLGYPGTMGSASVDYLIADPILVPAGAEHDYSEKIVRLPDCYQPNDRKRTIAGTPAGRAEAGLPASGVVLCCFNQTYKILPEVFAAWMHALRAVPDAVLWLLESNSLATENLRREAGQRGVDPARIVFAPKLPLEQHLARYRLADLALDTFPYGSHTTASDALWAGCPLVALAGDTFASRVSASILNSAGLPELITRTIDEYREQVIALAHNPLRLRELRAQLEKNRSEAPLFDAPHFTRALEQAYEKMHARRLAGEPPEHFDVL